MITVTLENGASFKVSKQNVVRFYDAPSGSGSILEYNSDGVGTPVIKTVTESAADIQTAESSWFLELTLSLGTIYVNPLKVISVEANGGGSLVSFGTDQFSTITYSASESATDVATVIDAASSTGGSTYSVYTALLTQTSTNAPVATVLENTLGITPTWVRDTTGAYYVQDNIFTTPKTVCFIGSPSARQHIYTMIVDSNQVYITTFYNGTDTDGLLSNTSIEIRVYP